MKYMIKSTILSFCLLSSLDIKNAYAFLPAQNGFTRTIPVKPLNQRQYGFSRNNIATRMSDSNRQEGQDDEIERLRSMAAKLRAEASALEAEKVQQMADAADRAFRQFDINQDGNISVAELKSGLEKAFKTELSDQRVQKLMEEFDASGDGALQLDEFVGVEQFRNRLESLAREEKRQAREAQEIATKQEAEVALAAARLEILNDKPPTTQDKALSLLPYLFPLLDGLTYGRTLLTSEGNEGNPLVVGLALIYSLYRAIPFQGFVAFFALSFLAGNPSINRLIRFNMQQAIFLDIALFFPGLVTAIIGLVLGGANVELPESVKDIGNLGIFFTLAATILYCCVSSIVGQEPDKIPFISESVQSRMPTLDMFDEEGRFVPKDIRDEEKTDEKSDDDKDKK